MKETPTAWDLFDIAVRSARRIFLWGPPAVGKSFAGLKALSTPEKPAWQITLNEDVVVQELLGHFLPQGDIFVWNDAPVALAFRNGDGLVINELGRASGAVKDMFLGVLDDPSIALLSLPNGKRVRPGEGFRVVLTSNTPPDDLDEALRDRLDAILQVKVPHPGIIKNLNRRLPNLGTAVADSYADAKRALSPRKAFAFLDFQASGVPADIAARLAFGNRAPDVLASLKARGIVRKGRKRRKR